MTTGNFAPLGASSATVRVHDGNTLVAQLSGQTGVLDTASAMPIAGGGSDDATQPAQLQRGLRHRQPAARRLALLHYGPPERDLECRYGHYSAEWTQLRGHQCGGDPRRAVGDRGSNRAPDPRRRTWGRSPSPGKRFRCNPR